MADSPRPSPRFPGLSHFAPPEPTRPVRGATDLGSRPVDLRPPPASPSPKSVAGMLQEAISGGLAAARAPEPPSTETIGEVALVEARLRALAARESPVLVRAAGGVVRGRLVAAYSDGPFPLQLALPEAVEAPFDLEIQGYNSLYRIRVERSLKIGATVGVPAPERLVRLQHRRSRRALVPPGYTVAFVHPAFPELEVRRPLRDVSRHGLCFETRVEQDLVVPGLRLRDVVVTTPSGGILHFDAEVRIVFPPRDGRGPSCGVRLTPSTALDAERWEQLVGTVLNPTTRLGATWSEDTWDLYTTSGYFNLSNKSGPHFAALKAPFTSVIRKLDAAPNVGCQVVWPSERGVEASLSLLKVYEQTWFGYQMAKLPGAPPDGHSGRQVLRDIHLRAYEHAQSDPSLKWTMALVQRAAMWSKLVHYDLPARYTDTGLATIVDFHALEIDVPTRVVPVPGALPVGEATAEEVERFVAALEPRRPWVYREALDLVPDRFALGSIRAEWSKAGFTRERSLLVARRSGRMVAAALVESADPGLHLFNLLDVVRVFAMAPDGEAAFPSLLDAAAAWYRARARTSFTCLLEEGTPACAARLTPRDLGAGWLTLLSTELLPSFLEHVYEVTAPRLPRN